MSVLPKLFGKSTFTLGDKFFSLLTEQQGNKQKIKFRICRHCEYESICSATTVLEGNWNSRIPKSNIYLVLVSSSTRWGRGVSRWLVEFATHCLAFPVNSYVGLTSISGMYCTRRKEGVPCRTTVSAKVKVRLSSSFYSGLTSQCTQFTCKPIWCLSLPHWVNISDFIPRTSFLFKWPLALTVSNIGFSRL